MIPLMATGQKDKVLGKWWNDKGTAQIKIFESTDGKFYGKIVYMDNPEKLDKNNPFPERRDQKIMGLIILRKFSYNSKKEQWSGGTIYDPDNGKSYDCYMWFNDNPDVLSIKGYVLGMKFIGRETKWKKVKE
jgi:uncharacterized protein (DUF2147 family)